MKNKLKSTIKSNNFYLVRQKRAMSNSLKKSI